MSARIYLSTFGSFGDVHPYVALAQALQDRGAEPLVFVNPAFRELFESRGLEAQAVGEPIDVETLLREEPKYLHPRNGTRFAMEDLFAPFAVQTLRAAEALASTRPPAACVSHHLAVGPAWLAQRFGVPSVVAHLAPASLLSRATPPVIGPGRTAPWVRRLILRLALPMFRRLAETIYRRAGAAAGVALGDIDVPQSLSHADLTLGLWPEVFRGPAADDPPGTHLVGFPPAPAVEGGASPELAAFLEGGAPPVAFGLGSSAVFQAGDFFGQAVAACEALGVRGVLFGAAEPPAALPASVCAVAFEPFAEVLPRCAAFVHHGSIGSTAAGLAAGVPTVIVPFAHDQFDNAACAEALGVSQTLQRKHLSAARLAAALTRAQDDGGRQRARGVAGQVAAAGDGARNAAGAVLGLLGADATGA